MTHCARTIRRLGYAKAEVRVLDPVETEGMTVADLDTLRSKVRDMIAAARDDLRREFADARDHDRVLVQSTLVNTRSEPVAD